MLLRNKDGSSCDGGDAFPLPWLSLSASRSCFARRVPLLPLSLSTRPAARPRFAIGTGPIVHTLQVHVRAEQRRGRWRCRYRRLGSDVIWPGGSKEAPLPENVLRIGVLLPQTGSWYAGRTILGAARVAVDDINNDPTLLGNYVAELKWRDSGCAAPQGIAAMSAMVEDKNIGAIIGPGTSSGIRGFDVLPGLWTWRIASSACWGHVRLERSSHAAGSDRLFGVACSLQRRLRGHGAPRSLPCCAEREWTRPD